jgi:hypothetical protein
MAIENVFIADVDLEGSPIVRDELREDVIEEYMEIYKASGTDAMPPPDLFRVPKSKFFLIGDGAHRIHAARDAGLKQIPCQVRDGTPQDCVMFALRSNQRHGLRRSNDDKRQCISTAILQFPEISDRQIGEICGVSNHLVGLVRKDLIAKGESEAAETRTDTQGREQPAEKPEPKPAAKAKGGKAVLDEEGFPITQRGLAYWERRGEIQELLSAISSLKARLNRAASERDALFYGISFNRAIDGLSDVYANVGNANPHTVCTECEGHPEVKVNEHCGFCGGKGLISKFQWDQQTPKEKKDLRTKAIESMGKKK